MSETAALTRLTPPAALAQEAQRELAITRRLLERVPTDKNRHRYDLDFLTVVRPLTTRAGGEVIGDY